MLMVITAMGFHEEELASLPIGAPRRIGLDALVRLEWSKSRPDAS